MMEVANFPEPGCVGIHPVTERPGMHSLENPYVGWRWYQDGPLYEISDTGKRTPVPRVRGEVLPSRRAAQRAAERAFPRITGWKPYRTTNRLYATVRPL